ncbi:globin family protein [Solimonas marina]|uniref:Hemin receptor n=1 Tax=Solimonas marina TaxID=2714601 RepID=A0A970BB37_9GAMM|nr:globin family protein [Solimonas marina]NKF23991.1 hemin receptor [Solimonas marina]
MTPTQIALVQHSWTQVLPIRTQAAALFYGRLFELDPSLRALFRAPIAEQGEKLMDMIDVAVRGLDRIDALVPAVQALGARHVGYGVQPAHYATVGAALLWTLEQGLGPAFDAELRSAWTAVYGALAGAMQSATAVTPATSD